MISFVSGNIEIIDRIAINQRHRAAVAESIENLRQAAVEIDVENYEIAAMLLRSACERLAGLEKEDIDEKILERIFANFCIGK